MMEQKVEGKWSNKSFNNVMQIQKALLPNEEELESERDVKSKCVMAASQVAYKELVAISLKNNVIFTGYPVMGRQVKVMKSHVLTMNAPARINVPVGRSQNTAAKESMIRHKRGRLIGSKDSALWKRRNEESSSCPLEEARNAPEEVPPEEAHNTPEDVMIKPLSL
ncbi:hypothetical protein AAC387_Pa01g2135 [Persea americana]